VSSRLQEELHNFVDLKLHGHLFVRPTALAITRAERAFFGSERTAAARVSGCGVVGFIAWLAGIRRGALQSHPYLFGHYPGERSQASGLLELGKLYADEMVVRIADLLSLFEGNPRNPAHVDK